MHIALQFMQSHLDHNVAQLCHNTRERVAPCKNIARQGGTNGHTNGHLVLRMKRSHQLNRPSLSPDTTECRVQLGREFGRPPLSTQKNTGKFSNSQLIFRENHGAIIRVIDLADVHHLTIGRNRNCDLIIDDPEVSRLHCVLYKEGEKFFVADAGSSQGLRADGTRWLRKRLETGTLLQFGAINAVVAHPESPYQSDASTLDEISDGNDDLDLGSIFAEAESEAPQAPTAPDHH